MPPRGSILERVAEKCGTIDFEQVFDDFASEHAHLFMDAAEAKSNEDVEHKHEYVEGSISVLLSHIHSQ